jgi:hypothetical protein
MEFSLSTMQIFIVIVILSVIFRDKLKSLSSILHAFADEYNSAYIDKNEDECDETDKSIKKS